MEAKNLYHPELFASAERLMLFTKMTVENYIHGIHVASKMQPGQVFSQYRNYQPGDDLRRLDWKKYARTEKYYVIESEIDSHLEIEIVMDASASLAHQDKNLTKWDYTRMLGAALAWLALSQGDQVSVVVVSETETQSFELNDRRNSFLHFLDALIRIEPKGKLIAENFEKLLYRPKSKKLTIVISDLYEQNGEWTYFINQAAQPFRELLVYQIFAENEWNFQFDTDTFLDLETGEELEFSGSTSGDQWRKKLKANVDYWKKSLEKHQGIYISGVMNQSIESLLSQMVELKNRLT